MKKTLNMVWFFGLLATLTVLIAVDAVLIAFGGFDGIGSGSETAAVTADTDFDKLESDKVTEDEFFKGYKEFYDIIQGAEYIMIENGLSFNFSSTNTNYTAEISSSTTDAPQTEQFIFKRDGAKFQSEAEAKSGAFTAFSVLSENKISLYDKSGKLINEFSEDFINREKQNREQDWNLIKTETKDININDYYNDKTKQYEMSTTIDTKSSFDRIMKFKNGHIVYCTMPSTYDYYVYKFYDFGTTTVTLPWETNSQKSEATPQNENPNKPVDKQEVYELLKYLRGNGYVEFGIPSSYVKFKSYINNGAELFCVYEYDKTTQSYIFAGEIYYNFALEDGTYLSVSLNQKNQWEGEIYSQEEF